MTTVCLIDTVTNKIFKQESKSKMSQVLRDARRYEEAKEQYISKEMRPEFHLSARVGWMNDPNGFSYYMGKYHMFYQYHPYDSHWGPMHWGHAVSTDLLHWEYLPAALGPDRLYDRDGCFSGSAITLPDGRQMLMYTGVVAETLSNGDVRETQTQNIAIGDGLDYEKIPENPVLTEKDLPAGGSKYGFRDPKMYRLSDGTYCALLANNSADNGGQILIYRSKDGIHWEYDRVLASNHNRIGRMWECPDFFELDGKYVLLASSQDMMPKGLEYHNGNGTFYMVGDFDPQAEKFTEEVDHAVDYGIDFYAPQTVEMPDGRRVMIGWMQNWDTCNLHTKSTPWFGQMTLPRELHVKDGVLYQTPIKELEDLRSNKAEYKNVVLEDSYVIFPDIKGRCVDMEVEVEPLDREKLYDKFVIHFAESDEYKSWVSFVPEESTVKIDRKFSGSRRAIIHQRRARVKNTDGRMKFRVILDRYSAEIFLNDGEKVMTFTLNTDLAADGISFIAEGGVKFNVVKYSLSE